MEGARRPAQQRLAASIVSLLDLFAAGAGGFRRACYCFVVRAMLRNETHRLAIAVSLGLGYLLSFENGGQALPAIYLLVLGLRIAFELPAGVSSNWIFRATLDPRENEALPVARRLMLGFVVPFVLIPSFAWSWWRSGLVSSALDTSFALALTLILIEIQLAGYRKVPLTCPMPGFRDHALMLCLIQFLGFELFTRGGAAAEEWMFAMPVRLILLPTVMAAGWYWNRRRIADAREAGELEEGVTFENAPVRVVERLNLMDGA
jgi:hypothetical protein